MSVTIYPKNVKPGDRMLTTQGMREVLSVVRDGAVTSITVQSVGTASGTTVLRCFERPGVKLTVERKASKP